MYQVSIFNQSTETVIHTPNPDRNAPHLLNLKLKETLSQAEQLIFSIPFNNPGYSIVQGLITKVRVKNTKDNSVVFVGRVIPTKDGMSSDGKFTNEVTAEGAMNYLIDSQTRRWHFENQTPSQILQYLLNQHNSKMDNERKVYLGIVQITQPITIDTNYESTLNTMIAKIRNVLGGDLRVQERSGVLYLDYLIAQGANNEVKIELRRNLKEFIREYDPMDIITRAIPLGYGEGINQLDITSVNGGIEYIEDSTAIVKYGIIEGVPTNKDIQTADTLKIYGQTVLNEKKQPSLTYSIGALDLSVLAGHEGEKYDLGDTLHTIVDVMNIDVYARVVERERDLINSPWDPQLTISTRPITLTDQIVDLKQRNLTLENAPQGNTSIFPISKAENADATHPLEFDLDIPKETININRVYLNLHGRKYRAYEKGATSKQVLTTTSSSSITTSGPSSATTSGASSISTSGASSSTTSGSSSSTTTSTQDNHRHMMFRNIETSSPIEDFVRAYGFNYSKSPDSTVPVEIYFPMTDTPGIEDMYTYEANGGHSHGMSHTHNIAHTHGMAHTHDMTHNHNMEHTHEIQIDSEEVDIIYGIYEGSFPKNVRVKVNGNDIGVNYGESGDSAIDEYNINITPYVSIGNNKIQIITEQNGRIDAVVYSQIFIQSR